MPNAPVAHFLAISGPLAGRAIPIAGPDFIIGREATSDLEIPDLSVSRPHCSIAVDRDRCVLTDRNSANGTFVNDERLVGSHVLRDGDRVAIGSSEFVFRAGSQPFEVEFDDNTVVSDSTIRIRVDSPQPAATGEPRATRDLNRLMRLAETIKPLLNLEAIQRELLGAIFEIAPAQRGAVIVIENSLDELRCAVGIERDAQLERRPIAVSRTIAARALEEKSAVLINDILQSAEAPASLRARPIRALAAVPFLVEGRAVGLLYIESGEPLDSSHFQWFLAAGGIASLAVTNLDRVASLERANENLRSEIGPAQQMIGDSAAMQPVYQMMARVARSDSSVLILGETGTGKELAARQIHSDSPRAARPFVAINCAVLSDQLLESELFGHERGAFTGAVSQKRGKLEIAQGGTLFLDEIGELPLALQAKLLRVIQEREFERVGGLRPIPADLRIIAATNRDPGHEIEQGRFRADLFYRLNVVTITMPALRERPADILQLASAFVARSAQRCGRKVMGVSAEAAAILSAYLWPGNVRELANVIERAVVLGSGEWIHPEDLPEEIVHAGGSLSVPVPPYHEAVRDAKREIIRRTFIQFNGNYVEAARGLGIHVNNLHRLIRELDLKSSLDSRRNQTNIN